MSFEKAAGSAHLSREQVETLLPATVRWIPLTYHQRPTLLATIWDILAGTWTGAHRRPFDLVHARGTVAAPMAAGVSSVLRIPWLFDVRGLLAQEYVDAGHWRSDGALQRLTRSAERALIKDADGLVLLSRRAVVHLAEERILPPNRPRAVIPCAVDLQRFRPDSVARSRVRRELGLGDEPVLVYSGSLGSWYLPGDMLDFFEASRQHIAGLRFLALTPQPQVAEREIDRRHLRASVTVKTLPPDAVAAHLAAADIGISFIAPAPSKLASSPTKLAEYLACGLPVVTNAGVGDIQDLVAEPSCIVLDELNPESYARAASRLRDLVQSSSRRSMARELAVRRFALDAALDAYDALYRRIVGRKSA